MTNSTVMALAPLADTIVWDGSPVLRPDQPFPTHYWCNGSLRRTRTPRYKVGEAIQHLRDGQGAFTIGQLGVRQFRSHPPEVVYYLTDPRNRSLLDGEVF